MMRMIRRMIYALGFKPKEGSIFFSPSRALVEGYSTGWWESYLKGFEHGSPFYDSENIQLGGIDNSGVKAKLETTNPTLTFSEVEERIKKILALPNTGHLGIITALNQHENEEEPKVDFSLKSEQDGFNDWFSDLSHTMHVSRNGDIFHCPQCGAHLRNFDWYFKCDLHGRFDISIENYRLVVRSDQKGV